MVKFIANSRRRAAEYEKDLAQIWKANRTFERSVEQRSADTTYVFYDGPPFISGVPHHGTLLSSIVKDAIPRYQTMKGKRVERVWGWDCHGLPAERFTEKKLGIEGGKAVHEYGLEKYIIACRENMVQTSREWNDVVERVGRWVDMEHSYKTMDKEYMESVWWAFKELYEKGSIYQGEKVLMYCTNDATPLSKAEVTMDAGAYQDVTDPSVFVKFALASVEADPVFCDTSFLAWTTTPWTLSANTALAVNPDFVYAIVSVAGEKILVAKDLIPKVLVDDKKQPLAYDFLYECDGKELIGKAYVPLFETDEKSENAFRVYAADYVTAESGSGIVHIAPAYGEEDFALATAQDVPVVHTIDENGVYTSGEWSGKNIWEVNKEIAKTLHERGVVWKIEYIRHSYPHCHRCGTKLMYRAHPSWFMNIDEQRARMLEQNSENINWFPEHIKYGRFAKTIETAPDWNVSRDRFWATAMPVWEGKDTSGTVHRKVIGSYEELKQLSGVELEDYHRPWVDDVTFTIDGVEYRRIDKVLDCWFESGSMPFAQFHYPFENKQKFEANFPGDFIVEYVGQVRAWFYYVHAVNVALFGHNAFKNVIVTGNVAGNDGRKMSKSYGNFTPPTELMDKYSADSLRFLLLSSPLLSGEDFALQDREVADVARKLSMVWNMYDFFTMYAEVDGWEFDGVRDSAVENLKNPLDRWIVSRVHQLVKEVETHLDAYDIPNAMERIVPFIEDASNWFVRRSRRRFWKSDEEEDKDAAYRTLHYVLLRLSFVLAPFTPFLADELFRKLTGQESVHLEDWWSAGEIDETLLSEMAIVRGYVNEGLSVRAKERQKVRQPLAGVSVPSNGSLFSFAEILQDELNVKVVHFGEEFALDLAITPELKSEGLAREIIRCVQNARKQADLNIDDRIIVSLASSSADIMTAVALFTEEISRETLAEKCTNTGTYAYKTTAKIDGHEVVLSLEKVL